MSDEVAQAIIKKALADDLFRVGLANDFDKTLSDRGIQLPKEQHEALKAVDWKSALPSDTQASKWVHIYDGRVAGKDIGGAKLDVGRPGNLGGL